MPGPTLTPEQIAQMKKESAKATAAAETFTAQIAAQQARAAELALVDSAFKSFFDYYNDQIIVKYDAERKLLNGNYVAAPITEADVLSCANLAGGRIQPTMPATDVIRLPQFDGSPLIVDPINEIQLMTDQATAETTLVSGFGGSPLSPTVVTDSAIATGVTALKLTDPTSAFYIAPNQVFIVSNGSDFAVIKAITAVLEDDPVPPPYVMNLDIEILVQPTGTLSTGLSLLSFSGFSNGERAIKTASDPAMQPFMDYLILELQNKVNGRITNLTAQLTSISTNQDPEGTAEFTQATTNVNTSKTFLTNYIISTDISDAGFTTTSAERSTRSSQATARVAEIASAYTGRTLNYYDQRYNFANNRANTARGSLRLQKNSEAGAATSGAYASTLGDQASAIGSILP